MSTQSNNLTIQNVWPVCESSFRAAFKDVLAEGEINTYLDKFRVELTKQMQQGQGSQQEQARTATR